MPEVIMTHTESTVTNSTDVTYQIKELTDCMDSADLMPNGFSDSDESLDNESQSYQPISKRAQEVIETEKRLLHTLGLKNELFERRAPLKIYKNKKPEEKHEKHLHVRPKSTGTTHSRSDIQNDDDKIKHDSAHHGKTQQQNIDNTTNTQHHHKHHHHNNHHHHHGKSHHVTSHNHKEDKPHSISRQNSQEKHHNNHHNRHHNHHRHHSHSQHHDVTNGKDHHSKHVQGKAQTGNEKHDIVDCFDSESTALDENFFDIISSGQSQELLNLTIMSPPPPEVTSEFPRCSSSYSCRTMSLKFLLAGETILCDFDENKSKESKETLLSDPVNEANTVCLCSVYQSSDSNFMGWETQQKGNRTKVFRRKKYVKPGSSEVAFNRLTNTMGKDPVIFQHYKDNTKYIERYRFYHTVGNVGRPITYTKYAEKGVDTDPYYNKMKSNLSSVINGPFYGLASQLLEDQTGSASNKNSQYERPRSDDESIDDNSVDARPYSMRDRGKALNLAPVRECTVPNLRATDKIDIMQLNKYLNLSTPPVPNNCIQFNLDEVKSKGYVNAGETNMFPASNSRKVGRTLRLGSAEFVKPGMPDSFLKWNTEKRGLHRSTLHASSSMPGNLIVGSTVTSPVPPNTARAKSSGGSSPYVQFQREHLQSPSTPPQHISGQKLKACERVTELSGKDRGKFVYTHAATNSDRPTPPVRTATAVDFKEAYVPRVRSRAITLDVNHLGIRGQPFKQREQIVLYKNRRAQVAKS